MRLARESLSGHAIPRVALPRYADHGDLPAARERIPDWSPASTAASQASRSRLPVWLLHLSPSGGRASRLIGHGSAAYGDRQHSHSAMNSNYFSIAVNSLGSDTLRVGQLEMR